MNNEEDLQLPALETFTNGIDPDSISTNILQSIDVKKKAIDILEEISPLRMTCNKPVPLLTPVIKIGDSIISTPGNITTITGESKSGKTAALGAVMAGAIAGGEYDGFKNLTIKCNDQHLPTIHIETEQSESRHQVNHRTIIKRSGHIDTPDYFFSYNIRQKEIAKYKQIVETACEGAMRKFGGIFLLVIDGIADFIADVNTAGEANDIIHWLEVLAITYNTPVIVVVHVNPGTDKERGHLGSQLQRKAESVLHIKREEDVSAMEPKLLRNAGIGDTPTIYFSYDKDKGYHVSRDTDPGLIEIANDIKKIEDLKKIATRILGGQNALKYENAIDAIMKTTKKSINIAKGKFKEMKAHEIIIQADDKRWRMNF